MESFWFFMAILMSFVTSLKEISIKSNLKDINSNTLIFLLSWLSIIFWLPFLLYQWIPELSLKFWLVFFISGILFYIWKLFNFKAMQAEDISFIAPLKWLVSIWAIIVWIFILNEYPSLIWWIWITVILLWAYFLNLQKYHTKFLDPFIHIVTNKWSRYYLVSVLAYSFTVILDKIWVLESSIIFWIFMMQLFLFCVSSKNFKKSFIESKIIIQKKYKFILLSFILYAVGIFFANDSYSIYFCMICLSH